MEASIRVDTRRADRPLSASPPPPSLSGLKVALVHDWLTGMRGGEKCLEVLCKAFPDATLHTLIHRTGALSPAIERMNIRTSPLQHLPGVFRHYRKLLPLMPLAARTFKPGDVDLVISLSHCVAKSVRVPKGVPHVSYCFTPMRYAWQGREAYLHSWANQPLRRILARILLDRLRDWDRETSSRVSDFVAISETVRGRIDRFYNRESTVIHPPVDTAFYTPDLATPRGGFYLCVSALVPYKRIDQAIAACSALNRPLIVIGDGPDRARLKRLAGPSVQFLGWQSDTQIRDHYRRCKALLFPGEEDFGIVPIEALACQSPVIALNRGGVAETVDSQVGATYSEPTTEALQAAITRWESAGCPHDPILARQKAESFSLPIFRDKLFEFLESVVTRWEPDRVPPPPHITL